MTFDQLKKRIGKNIKYYDDTNGWEASTGIDVTETDIGDYVNELYLDDLFPMFAAQYPQDFRQIALADSWIANGTVDASSTSTTLVTTTSIFSNSMTGLYVWNATDSELAKIESYTSATTVTLDTTIGDTWDGDSIYVLGQEFTFGGDSTDIYEIEAVGVKFTTTSTYFLKASQVRKHDFLAVGNETGAQGFPRWYPTTLKVSGVPTSAIGIYPKFQEKVSNAIEVHYIGKPASLSSSSDVPRLPVTNSLIYGGTARAFEKKQDFKSAGYWLQKYERQKGLDLANYRPLYTDDTLSVYPPRRLAYIHNRIV